MLILLIKLNMVLLLMMVIGNDVGDGVAFMDEVDITWVLTLIMMWCWLIIRS